MDILPGVLEGDSATGHGDYSWVSTTGQVLLLGGDSRSDSRCGLSCSNSYHDFASVYLTICARLAYYGVVDIV